MSNLNEGIEKLGAILLTDARHHGLYAYYDDGMGRYFLVEKEDVESYITDYVYNDNEQISSDAYSHWCAGTLAEEMPRGWNPINEFVDADLVVLEIMPDQYRSSHRAAGNFGVYPYNGSIRYVILRSEAEDIIKLDDEEYDHIVRNASSDDVAVYGIMGPHDFC